MANREAYVAAFNTEYEKYLEDLRTDMSFYLKEYTGPIRIEHRDSAAWKAAFEDFLDELSDQGHKYVIQKDEHHKCQHQFFSETKTMTVSKAPK